MHIHEDGIGHAHTHDHTHAHDHSHTHDHSHDHQSVGSIEETKALLAYMISHNEHHTEELADLLDTLPENAGKKLLTAIGAFEAANVDLQAVLDCL